MRYCLREAGPNRVENSDEGLYWGIGRGEGAGVGGDTIGMLLVMVKTWT